jgi:hypothetical protein
MKTKITCRAVAAALGLVAGCAGAAHADGPPAGRWSVDESTSALDDSKTYVARLDSTNDVVSSVGRDDHATLLIRCKAGALAAYVVWPRYFGSSPVPVAWKLDAGPIARETWDVSSSGTAVGFFDPAPTKALITSIRDAHRLVLQAAPYEAGPIEAVFDLDGVGVVADHALAACPS